MDGAPVGHDEARIAPVAFQDLVQEPVVLAGIDSVDLVVGAHDRAGATLLDPDLESEEVRLSRRRRIDPGVEHDAVGLLIVEGEVLDRRNDVTALRPGDHCPRHEAGDQRVFGKILENAPAARIPDEVRRAAEQDVESPAPGLGADRSALAPREREVPAGGQRQVGGHRRRRVARPYVPRVGDAELGVGFLQGRNSEPGDPGNVARRADRAFRLGLPAPGRAETAVDERQLLRLGHPFESGLGARGRFATLLAARRGHGRRCEKGEPA